MGRILLWLCLFPLFSFPQEHSFIYDGVERTYRLYVPEDHDDTRPSPLILNMHGLGSNAFEQQFYSNFDPIADTAGIIMVYPNGVDNSWNITAASGVDDVGFLSALIDTVAASYTIDMDRVYATGMSMGGFMSYRLACELSDRITAIASVTGLLAFSPCTPDRPIPILHIHGTEDQIVPYAGVMITIQQWLGINACYPLPTITEVPDTDTTDGCTVTISHYEECEGGSEILLYTVNGGEHTWPGAPVTIGITNRDIDGSKEIWKFFRQHSLDPTFGINESIREENAIHLFPNPVEALKTVTIISNVEQELVSVELRSVSGQKIMSATIPEKQFYDFSIPQLPPGLYFLHINLEDELIIRKIIIR